MDVGKISVKYIDGNEESFSISDSEVDKIKILADRIVVILCHEDNCRKKDCKVIITDNLQNYIISPCDEANLMSTFR